MEQMETNENRLAIKVAIPGLKELTEAINRLVAVSEGKPAQVMTTVNTAQPTSIPQPAQTSQPVQQPVQQPMPQTTVPTTTVPLTHTLDELSVAASQLVNMGKQQRLLEILHGFGIASMTELPQASYGAFAGCLKAEGVQI